MKSYDNIIERSTHVYHVTATDGYGDEHEDYFDISLEFHDEVRDAEPDGAACAA